MNISPKQYAELLQFIAEQVTDKEGLKKSIAKLAKLIVNNCDQKQFEEIVSCFEGLTKKQAGIVEARILSARALSQEQERSLQAAIASELDLKIELVQITKKVDKSLMGGVSIQIGDKVIDGSLKTKIEKLENSLS